MTSGSSSTIPQTKTVSLRPWHSRMLVVLHSSIYFCRAARLIMLASHTHAACLHRGSDVSDPVGSGARYLSIAPCIRGYHQSYRRMSHRGPSSVASFLLVGSKQKKKTHHLHERQRQRDESQDWGRVSVGLIMRGDPPQVISDGIVLEEVDCCRSHNFQHRRGSQSKAANDQTDFLNCPKQHHARSRHR